MEWSFRNDEGATGLAKLSSNFAGLAVLFFLARMFVALPRFFSTKLSRGLEFLQE